MIIINYEKQYTIIYFNIKITFPSSPIPLSLPAAIRADPNLSSVSSSAPRILNIILLNQWVDIRVGAASQWWSNKRMMVKWMYDHIIISPSLPSISPSLTSISPSLTNILPSLARCKPSFAHLSIIEKLHRLYCVVPLPQPYFRMQNYSWVCGLVHSFKPEPTSSDDLFTKHYISLKTFFIY